MVVLLLAGLECPVLSWYMVEIGSEALCGRFAVMVHQVGCPASSGFGDSAIVLGLAFGSTNGRRLLHKF